MATSLVHIGWYEDPLAERQVRTERVTVSCVGDLCNVESRNTNESQANGNLAMVSKPPRRNSPQDLGVTLLSVHTSHELPLPEKVLAQTKVESSSPFAKGDRYPS